MCENYLIPKNISNEYSAIKKKTENSCSRKIMDVICPKGLFGITVEVVCYIDG